MKHWTSPTYELSVRTKHSRTSLATRLLGLLILLLAVLFWPTAVLAADTGVETQRSAAVVFTLLLVTIVAVGAGVFVASPFGRRFLSGPTMALSTGSAAGAPGAAGTATAASSSSDRSLPVTQMAVPNPTARLMASPVDPVAGALPPTIPQLAPLPPIAPAPPVSVPAATEAPWSVEPAWPEIDLRAQPDANIRAHAQAQISSTAPAASTAPTRHFPAPWSTSEPSLSGSWNHSSRTERR